MIYTWHDNSSNKTVEIERPVKDYDDEPTLDECIGEGWTKEEWWGADWTKLVTGGSATIGFGQKGNW